MRGLGLRALRGLRLERARFGLQVDLHQLRRQVREEPDHEARADEVAHRVGDGDVVQQARFLFLGKRKAGDRVAGRADHGRLGERPGQETRCGAGVVAHQLRGHDRRDQAGDAQHERQQRLRASVLLEPAEELRADLVAGGEQEQVEEDDLDERVDADVELADHDARQQRPDDGAEAEAAEAEPPDREADRERQEDGELGILAKRRHEPVHGLRPLLRCWSLAEMPSSGSVSYRCRRPGPRERGPRGRAGSGARGRRARPSRACSRSGRSAPAFAGGSPWPFDP